MNNAEEVEIPTKDDVVNTMTNLIDKANDGVEDDTDTDDLDLVDDTPTETNDDPADETDETDDDLVSDTDDVLSELSENDDDDDDDEEDNEPEGLTESAAEAFKAIREKNKALKKQLTEGGGTDSETVTALEQKVVDLTSKLSSRDLKESPVFQRKFDAPIRQHAAYIQKQITDAGGEKDVFMKAAKLTGIDRKRFLNDAVPDYASEISQMFVPLDKARFDRFTALKDQAATQKDIGDESIAHRTELMTTAFSSARDTLVSDNNFLLSERDGKEKWNKQVQGRMETAKAVALAIDSATPEERAVLSLKAITFDEMKTLYLKERETRMKLQGKEVVRRKSTPRVNASTNRNGKPTKSKRPAIETGEDIAALVGKRDYGNGAARDVS